MKQTDWRLLTLLLAAALLSVAAAPRADFGARAKRVDRTLERLVPFGFSGAVAITDHGRVLLARGYGSRRDGADQPMDAATGFDIGSLSKTFTAAGIMRLAEAGRLSLEDSVASFFEGAPPDKRGITVAQLLTHTAGLPAFHDTSGDFEHMTADTALARILALRRAPDPAPRYRYSNSGYTLLALIAQRVTGEAFQPWLRREVFDRAGMTHSGWYDDARWGDSTHLARGSISGVDMGSPATWAPGRPLWALIGNGGVVSTAGDLAAFDRALSGDVLMRAASRERWFTPRVDAGGDARYAYGWMTGRDSAGGEAIGHDGANDFGFASRFQRFTASGVTVILLMNLQPEKTVDISVAREAVFRKITRTLFEGSDEAPPAARSPRPETIARLEGRWILPDSSAIAIEKSGSRLRATPFGGLAARGLAGLTPERAQLSEQLDARAVRIMNGLMRDDVAPLRASTPDSSRYAQLYGQIVGIVQRVSSAGGPIRETRVVATIPRWWTGSDEMATLIELHSERRRDVFRLHWDARQQLVAIGGAAIQTGPAVFVAEDASRKLMGYHPATDVRVTLKVDGDRLEVGTRLGTLVARREP